MPRAFATLTFTPHVKAAQTRYHSRDANHGFELGPDSGATLGPAEAEFIAARDSFYQATSGSNGWPYVQHRGGPVGFLQVLDAHTLAYADFRGNRQYLSVGNLGGNPRMALILMDYPNRRRLKLWCKARVVDADDDPALMAQLENPAYRARIERAIVLHVNAFDWNCPQHITPRFSAAEYHAELAPLQAELARLRQQLASQQQRPATLGDGPLPLRVRSVTRLAPRVLGLTLEHADGTALPAAAAGSHLSLPVLLPDGSSGWRPYSLTRIQPQRYQLAIQLAEDGRGGSRYIHQHYAPGLLLHCSPPAGHFRLPAEAANPVLLIAGGIGITPLMAMARQLCAAGQPPQLYYSGRGSDTLAFVDELTSLLGAAAALPRQPPRPAAGPGRAAGRAKRRYRGVRLRPGRHAGRAARRRAAAGLGAGPAAQRTLRGRRQPASGAVYAAAGAQPAQHRRGRRAKRAGGAGRARRASAAQLRKRPLRHLRGHGAGR